MNWKQFYALPNREKDILISKLIDKREIVRDEHRSFFADSILTEVPRYSTSERSIGRMMNAILISGCAIELSLSTNITKGPHIVKFKKSKEGIVLHFYDLNILLGAGVLFANGQLYYE